MPKPEKFVKRSEDKDLTSPAILLAILKTLEEIRDEIVSENRARMFEGMG